MGAVLRTKLETAGQEHEQQQGHENQRQDQGQELAYNLVSLSGKRANR